MDVASLSTPTFFQLQEEERYRLARALMDGPGQVLANTLVELEHSLAIIDTYPKAAVAGIAALREEVRQGLSDLKTLVAELQPPLLSEMGLAQCLRQYLSQFARRSGIQVECTGYDALQERLPSVIETAIFRIMQEALANVAQHSGATRVHVLIARRGDELQLRVQDNGQGFVKSQNGNAKRRQLGLAGMNDRAALVGGRLHVFSEAGKGLRVELTVPYHGGQEELDTSKGGTP